MEIRFRADVDQVNLIRSVRNLVHKDVILNRFTPVKDYVAHAYGGLFLLSRAASCKLQAAAFIYRNLIMPGR